MRVGPLHGHNSNLLLNLALNNVKCVQHTAVCKPWILSTKFSSTNLIIMHTGGIRQNLFENYYLKNYMHRARAALTRALAPRAKVGGISPL
jgi:hypothetical protein